MKTLFRGITIAVCLLTASVAFGQTSISPYKPGLTGEGAVYFLPKTALRISVLVEKTTYTPGDLASYAQRYLRLTNVGLEPTVSHRVISVSQMAIGVADPTKCYTVKYNPATVAANVVLSDDGCLLAVNAEANRPTLPAPFQPAAKEEPVNPRLFMSEEILAAGSTAKMAELTAQEIYDIRENRSLLVKGQADFMPKDGEQLRLMLNQLEKQDRALTSMFQGVTTRDTTEHIITYIPDGPVNHHVLFRLSNQLGMVDADDLSGAPFYINIDDLTSLPPTDELALAKAKLKKSKTTEQGIYYIIPGRMRATIFQGVQPIQSTEHPCAQFGNVELLGGNLFNRRFTTHLWLSPVSGALEKLLPLPVEPEKKK
ncbi:MAG: DUF4831 family protein [Prevotella sp.]|nr:DUF4831 family protein [Prevotella sp.]